MTIGSRVSWFSGITSEQVPNTIRSADLALDKHSGTRHAGNQDAAENDGNLHCESRMNRKSFWGWSHISEWIASDEC